MRRTITASARWLLLASAAVLLNWTTAGLSKPSAPALLTLRVGVNPTTMPLHNGTRDYTDDGLELVYARELATRLGAQLVLLPLLADAQAQAFDQHQVDVVLTRHAAGGNLGDRGHTVPTGYVSGLSVAMRSDTTAHQWSDLAGRVLCTTAVNQRAQALIQSLGGTLQVHSAPAQVLAQMRTGACDAAVLDQALLKPLFQRREWEKFSATLAPRDSTRLVAAVSTTWPEVASAVQDAIVALDSTALWDKRQATWAANVAFEVYFDQVGPDCH
jgi:polar amino acid transport system substrate-binding protein